MGERKRVLQRDLEEKVGVLARAINCRARLAGVSFVSLTNLAREKMVRTNSLCQRVYIEFLREK